MYLYKFSMIKWQDEILHKSHHLGVNVHKKLFEL